MAAPAAAAYPLASYSSPLAELSDDNMAIESNSDSDQPAPVVPFHARYQHPPAPDDDSDAEGDVDADADGDADVDAEGDPDYADDADAAPPTNDVYPTAGGSGVSSKVSVCLNFYFIYVWGNYLVAKYGIFLLVIFSYPI